MTQKEFSELKFSAGMRVKHILSGETYDIVTVNFKEDLIGVDALDRETCEFCKEDYPIISWFRCENCVILK